MAMLVVAPSGMPSSSSSCHVQGACSGVGFVVLKGYHMGSKWFAEAMNRVPGAAFFFEYEHCLRKQSLEHQASIPALAQNTTLRFLRTSCQCTSFDCRGCSDAAAAEVEHADMTAQAAAARSEGQAQLPYCHASGVSVGASDPSTQEHIRALVHLEPRIKFVVHVRSNHVKQALSFLRVSCSGQKNHAYEDKAHGHQEDGHLILHVPPPVLLAKTVAAAKAHFQVLDLAERLSGGRIAYVLVYEKMQQDMGHELNELLKAVGGAPLHGQLSPQEPRAAQVKAGAEDVAETLDNYDEMLRFFAPVECFHRMLAARGFVPFPLRDCANDGSGASAVRILDGIGERAKASLDEDSLNRTRLLLKPSECLTSSNASRR